MLCFEPVGTVNTGNLPPNARRRCCASRPVRRCCSCCLTASPAAGARRCGRAPASWPATPATLRFSALGLGAVLLASHEVFTLVKYLGALYLVYLGVQTVRGVPETDEPPLRRHVGRRGHGRGVRRRTLSRRCRGKSRLETFGYEPWRAVSFSVAWVAVFDGCAHELDDIRHGLRRCRFLRQALTQSGQVDEPRQPRPTSRQRTARIPITG